MENTHDNFNTVIQLFTTFNFAAVVGQSYFEDFIKTKVYKLDERLAPQKALIHNTAYICKQTLVNENAFDALSKRVDQDLLNLDNDVKNIYSKNRPSNMEQLCLFSGMIGIFQLFLISLSKHSWILNSLNLMSFLAFSYIVFFCVKITKDAGHCKCRSFKSILFHAVGFLIVPLIVSFCAQDRLIHFYNRTCFGFIDNHNIYITPAICLSSFFTYAFIIYKQASNTDTEITSLMDQAKNTLDIRRDTYMDILGSNFNRSVNISSQDNRADDIKEVPNPLQKAQDILRTLKRT